MNRLQDLKHRERVLKSRIEYRITELENLNKLTEQALYDIKVAFLERESFAEELLNLQSEADYKRDIKAEEKEGKQ